MYHFILTLLHKLSSLRQSSPQQQQEESKEESKEEEKEENLFTHYQQLVEHRQKYAASSAKTPDGERFDEQGYKVLIEDFVEDLEVVVKLGEAAEEMCKLRD